MPMNNPSVVSGAGSLLKAAALVHETPFGRRAPLLAGAALPASTTVYNGDIYTNSGSTWCCQTTGTVGAGPTLTAGANLCDPVTAGGTATFVYMGPTTAPVTNDQDMPTSVVEIRPGSLMGMRQIAANTNISAFTFTATWAPTVRSGVASPCQWSNASSFNGSTAVTSLIGYDTSMSRRIGFVTRSKRVYISGPGNYQPGQYYYEVNGKPLFEYGCWNASSVLAGGESGLLITFADARPRTFWCGLLRPYEWSDVWVDNGESITPAATVPVRMVCEGDSLTDGTSTGILHWRGDWPSIVADSLGIQDVWNVANGGTGFMSPGTASNPITNPKRVAVILAAKPNIIVVGGAHNDGSYTSAQRLAAFSSWLSKIRAGLPYVQILFFGSTPLRGNVYSSSLLPIDTDIANFVASANSAGDKNIYYLPTTNFGEPWVPVGTTDSPYFQTSADIHPARAGIEYFASQYTAAIRRWATAN